MRKSISVCSVLEQAASPFDMAKQLVDFAVKSEQIAKAGAALDDLISGFHAPMSHDMGSIAISDNVFAALDLEAIQQKVHSAAFSPVSVAQLLMPVAAIALANVALSVGVAPEFENRMSSIEMRVFNIYTKCIKCRR